MNQYFLRNENKNKVNMKIKVTFLLDKKNFNLSKNIIKNFYSNKKYIIKKSFESKKISNQDIVFVLNYTKILPNKFLKDNKLVVVPHSSNLPMDKGFAPIQNQILRNKKKIFVSLVKADVNHSVDSGPIFLKDYFMLDGTELFDEIISKAIKADIKIIKKFLKEYPRIRSFNQSGKGKFNKKRYPEDSQININQSLKKQFNNLRINNNKDYPSYFLFKGFKYIIKIYKRKISKD